MKDFPINALLAASDTHSIRSALVNVFAHLKRVRNTEYPPSRALKLLQAISRDVTERLLKTLAKQGLLTMSYHDFDRVIHGCELVFAAWDHEDEKFRGVLRTMLQRRRDESIRLVGRINPSHKQLKERLLDLNKFRSDHEKLQTVIVRILRSVSSDGEVMVDADDRQAIDEVARAYEEVRDVDPLDLTDDGEAAWMHAQERYGERIERVESRVTTKLRDELGTTHGANEMFRVFGKYKGLFTRPKVRSAVLEYQSQLLQNVKSDIAKLQKTHEVAYEETLNARMSVVRDLPPVSGQIIWARQLDRQLQSYVQRVEDVLGRAWESHMEGKTLRKEVDEFRKRLDTATLFKQWTEEVKLQMGLNGNVFLLQRNDGKVAISINFPSNIITLSKEVRNLKWLNCRVPLAIVNKSFQAHTHYPSAITLKASVRTYQQTLEKLSENPSVLPLVAEYHRGIQAVLSETGFVLKWEDYRLDSFSRDFAVKTTVFQEKVDDILAANERLSASLLGLESCEYAASTLHHILEAIQKVVDELNLRNYANLPAWVADLDAQVEQRLVARASTALAYWVTAYVMLASCCRTAAFQPPPTPRTLPSFSPYLPEQQPTAKRPWSHAALLVVVIPIAHSYRLHPKPRPAPTVCGTPIQAQRLWRGPSHRAGR